MQVEEERVEEEQAEEEERVEEEAEERRGRGAAREQRERKVEGCVGPGVRLRGSSAFPVLETDAPWEQEIRRTKP